MFRISSFPPPICSLSHQSLFSLKNRRLRGDLIVIFNILMRGSGGPGTFCAKMFLIVTLTKEPFEPQKPKMVGWKQGQTLWKISEILSLTLFPGPDEILHIQKTLWHTTASNVYDINTWLVQLSLSHFCSNTSPCELCRWDTHDLWVQNNYLWSISPVVF